MAFWASEFIFDDVPSSTYNLFISTADGGGGLDSVVASSGIEIYTTKVLRNPKPYFYGVSQSPVLEFDITIMSPEKLDSDTAKTVQRWLFGHTSYKKLQIVQNDMQEIFFNCFLNNPNILKSGNEISGFKATVVCDSPFAWTYPKTTTRTYTDPVISETYTFYNDSDDNDYLYPDMTVSMNATGGDISIINDNDSSREFSFTDISPSEVLTINNRLGMISSSLSLNRLGDFNKKWMRFVPGNNVIQISGNVSEIVFTYQLARKVGT